MKLPNFFQSEQLNRLKETMGIPKDVYGSLNVEIEPGRLTPLELDALTSGPGIDVDFTQLTQLEDGTLAYKDSRVLVYIRDVHLMGHNQDMPKYHFYFCSTLELMSESGRFERYVISTTVDGTFSVNVMQNNKSQSKKLKLRVCKNCLNDIHIKGYDSLKMTQNEKERFVESFVPDDFFALYPRSLVTNKPKFDWTTHRGMSIHRIGDQISLAFRVQAGWKCQECHQDLSAQNLRRFLQTHHLNGARYDNSKTNLKALCIACHAARPNHGHMTNRADYIEFMEIKATNAHWSSKS